MHVCKSWDIARQVQGGREIRTCMFLTRAMRQRAAELPQRCTAMWCGYARTRSTKLVHAASELQQ